MPEIDAFDVNSSLEEIEEYDFLIGELREIFSTMIFSKIPNNDINKKDVSDSLYQEIISSSSKFFPLIRCIKEAVKVITSNPNNFEKIGINTLRNINDLMGIIEDKLDGLELKMNKNIRMFNGKIQILKN